MTLFSKCVCTTARAGIILFWALAGCSSSSGGPSSMPDSGAVREQDAGSLENHDGGPDAGFAEDSGASTLGPLGPTVVSVSRTSESEHEGNIVVARDGHVAVTWTGKGRASYDVLYRISIDGGESWGEPTALPLPSDDNIASNASLAARPDGTIVVVWASERVDSARNRTNVRVWLAEAATGATSFGAPKLVDEPGGTNAVDLPDVLLAPDGSLLVTYTSFSNPRAPSHITAARSSDGVTWTRARITESDPASRYGHARTCTANGRTYVTYSDFVTAIFLRSSDDGGATWPSERTLTVDRPGEEDFLPSLGGCVARGDEVWVMYVRTSDFAPPQPLYEHVLVAHSIDRGATLHETIEVTDPAAGTRFLAPTLAVDAASADLFVAYYAGNRDGDTEATFRVARSRDRGASFATSSVIDAHLLMSTSRSNTGWAGDYVGLEAVNGTLFMAFAQTSATSAHVAFARRPASD